MIVWTLGRKACTVKVVKFPIQLGDIWMKLKDRKKLLTIMEIQEVSRRELAMVAGWKSHSYMNRLCNGEVDTLQPEPALRIAKFLGVAVDDLFLTKVEEKAGHLESKSGKVRAA